MIEAQNVTLDASGDIMDSGAIAAGQNLMVAAGGNYTSQGPLAALSAGGSLGITVGGNLDLTGKLSAATGGISLVAGNDINLNAIGYTTYAENGPGEALTTTNQALTDLTAGGNVLLSAGGVLTSQGAGISAGNGIDLYGAQGVDLGAVLDSQTSQTGARGKHWSSSTTVTTETAMGTDLEAANDIYVGSGASLTTEAATIDSANGAVGLWSKGSMNVGTATETDTSNYSLADHGGGLFDSKITTVTDDIVATNAVGTVISGNTVSLLSQGNMTLLAATVAGSNGASLESGGSIDVVAATNTTQEHYDKTVVTSGLLGGAGIGFTVGQRTQSTTSDTTDDTLTGSIVGTLAGNSNVNAKTTYTQVASSLLSQSGEVNLDAGSVDITAGQESEQQTVDTLFKQSGLSVSVGGGLVGAIADAATTGQSLAQTASSSNSSRVKNLAAVAGAIKGYEAYQAISQDASALSKGSSATQGISVSITYGFSESTTHSVTNATNAVGSAVSGNDVNIAATGQNGANGNIDVTGSTIAAGENATLSAANNLSLDSAQDSYNNTTTDHNESASAGVAITASSGGWPSA